jgi:hypothetical protein
MSSELSSAMTDHRSHRSRETLEAIFDPAFEQLLMTLRALRVRIGRMRAFAQSLRDC